MNEEKWKKEMPTEEGEFYMRDESGGPTLYVFEMIDGILMNGPKSISFRWEADGTGHLPDSVEFKKV